ncbi:hypothetical protein [Corynebacterium phoceense]|uniref:hypothetical protein n=1 Tax=Corynebacterium phoceense TaxID=1686286 RepID=UPI0018A99DA4|nr:hypothetical protein [Corynebacterium phoceense]MBF9011331.1 hypothetical protein [Corynebacterium phoceense]
MTLNENTIRELLEQAAPGPWAALSTYEDGAERPDTTREMRSSDREYLGIMHGTNAQLAALAPELAAEVLRLHEALSAWIEDERAAENALHNASVLGNTATTHTTIINRINSILNGDIQ